jgi:diguanylate cyclase (GGDEF)-like protein/PAS domain S-box-containing protein
LKQAFRQKRQAVLRDNRMTQTNKFKEDLLATRVFHWVVILIGISVFLYSLVNLPLPKLGWEFCLIGILTLAVGSRISLNFELFKSTISISDVFIYLTAILFGGEVATVLVTVEAYISSSRFTKRAEFRAFNAGILAVSIFAAYKITFVFFGSLAEAAQNEITLNLFGATGVLIVSHYLVNSSVVATSTALRTDKPVFETWREFYSWMFFPFLASGSVALIAVNIIRISGFFAFLTILPVVGIIYFSYRSQQGRLQAVTEKAVQAKQHLVEMTESEARFRSAFSNAPIGMALISNDCKWLQTNQSLGEIFGYEPQELVEKQFRDYLHPGDLVNFNSNIGLLLQWKINSYHAELRYFDRHGNEIITQTSISHAGEGDEARLICQIQNITARHRAEEKLKHDAFYDSLTNLFNRTKLIQNLNEAIERAKNEPGYKFCAIFVDLDRFKLINDSIGHNIGDQLLVAVSQRIKNCLPQNSTLARLGSDEFFILLETSSLKPSKIEDIAQEILSQVSLEYLITGHQINITAGIGVVSYEPLHETAEEFLRDSDSALHIAKSRGRSTYVFFDAEMREIATNRMKLEKELVRAVERKEFFLVYQPIISLENKGLVGFEALVRWQHPTLGLVPPNDFISLAEENGTIVQIGQFVLDEACRQLKVWQKELSCELPLTISVNVSAKQLLQKNFFAEVLDTLGHHRILPRQIKLEITESVVVDNNDIVVSILRQFRAIGVKLSMDDFGTGYSSLSYLHRLPIDTLKIDRSFISLMTEETESSEIVRTILLLAKNLNLDVVAEGIETLAQQDILKDLNCDYGQGYYFSRPLTVEPAKQFIEDRLIKPDFIYLENTVNQSNFFAH